MVLVYFCGESMGGILGIALASQYPSLIKKLILVATPVYISDTMKNRYSLGHSSRLGGNEEVGN
jgi:3-oxoadipate enol-lactonase